MCRSDVAEHAQAILAEVLDLIATALAEDAGVPRDTVRIGPVDFGGEEEK